MPDYFSARKWRDNHESSDAIHGHSLHLHNLTFTNTLIGNSGNIYGKTYFKLSDNASKRSHQEVYTCIFFLAKVENQRKLIILYLNTFSTSSPSSPSKISRKNGQK